MALQGNINATDEHGHKETLRFRETAWGKKYIGLGANPKRDVVNKPFSSDELQVQSTFAQAAKLRKKVVSVSALKAAWRKRFNDEVEAGTTKCKTLGGYLMQQGFAGHISEAGEYQD